MITSITKFKKINESINNEYIVTKKFTKNKEVVYLNGKNKFIEAITFSVNDIITLEVIGKPIGYIVKINNKTTGDFAKYWLYSKGLDYVINTEGLPKDIGNSIKKYDRFSTMNENNSESLKKYIVTKTFFKPKQKIVLNGSSNTIENVKFAVGNIITYTVQGGSLGDIIRIYNKTTGYYAEYWAYEYGLPKDVKNCIKLYDENEPTDNIIKLNKTDSYNINDLFDDENLVDSLYEIFSEYIYMREHSDITDGSYEILFKNGSLFFNYLKSDSDKTIVWSKEIVLVNGLDNENDKLFDQVESDLAETDIDDQFIQ